MTIRVDASPAAETPSYAPACRRSTISSEEAATRAVTAQPVSSSNALTQASSS
jgi:hypothetical protein